MRFFAGLSVFVVFTFAVSLPVFAVDLNCSVESYQDKNLENDLVEGKEAPVLLYVFSNKMILSMTEIQSIVDIAEKRGWTLRLLFDGERCFDKKRFDRLLKGRMKHKIYQLQSFKVTEQTQNIHYPASFFLIPSEKMSRVVYGVMPKEIWESTLNLLLEEAKNEP